MNTLNEKKNVGTGTKVVLHKHLTQQLVLAIHEIFANPTAHADKVIERYLKAHKKWGARDRKFFAETVYELIRHFRKLWWQARLVDFPQGQPTPDLVDLNSVWTVWGTYFSQLGHELPDWPELRNVRVDKNESQKFPSKAIEQSVPDWLYDYGLKSFGPEWDQLLQALNVPAKVYLRTNKIKTSRAKLIATLEGNGVPAEAASVPSDLLDFKFCLDDAIQLKERKNVFRTDAFKNGLFEVQDAASQFVATMLQLESGLRVVDACAGGGGKTLHIATLMQNKGKVLSMDIHEWKLNELRNRAKRNGIDIVETRVIESTKTIKRLAESFDRVLLDVPCSGLGVLRRNPDAKWKFHQDEISRLLVLQEEILNSYSKMTKPGGVLVYATCSIFPDENERQVEKFLARNSSFKLDKQLHLRPDKHGFDGFYVARMHRESSVFV